MSKFGTLELPDYVKGILVAVIGAVLTTIEQALTSGGFGAIDFGAVALVAVNAGIGYLLKNFFTNAQGVAFGIKSTKVIDNVAP